MVGSFLGPEADGYLYGYTDASNGTGRLSTGTEINNFAVYCPPGVSLHRIFFNLYVQSSGDSAADFYHTASLSLKPNTPGSGLTYTSASGRFLTVSTTAPEPGSLAMLVSGIFGGSLCVLGARRCSLRGV